MNKNRQFIFGILVVTGMLILGITGWLAKHPPRREAKTLSPGPAKQTPESWPQFRANQQQTGVVEGYLPPSLKLAWRFPTGDEIKSSPVIHAGRVYVGSSDEKVYCLSLDQGQEVWATSVDDGVEATPAIHGDSLYVATLNGTLYALDSNSGAERWTYTMDDKVAGAVNWFKEPDGDLSIVVGSYDALVHCVDASNGQVSWTYETDSYVNGSPAVAAEFCAFGGCDAVIRVLSLADGNQVNAIDSGAYIAASAAIHNGFVFAGTYDGELLKAPMTGKEPVWRYTADGDPFISSPAVTDTLVVVGGGDGKVHGINQATGKTRWTFEALDTVDSSPAICGDKVVIGSHDGRLYLLNLENGKKLWSFEVGDAIVSSPAIAGGKVVVGCDDGVVYAFE